MDDVRRGSRLALARDSKLPELGKLGLDAQLLERQQSFIQPLVYLGPLRKWVHMDDKGDAQMVEVDRHELVRALGIRYRDLAAADPSLPIPSPAAILIRPKALIVNLETIRALICANQLWLLSVPSDRDPSQAAAPTLDSEFVRMLCACLARGPDGAWLQSSTATLLTKPEVHLDGSLPFELRALEVCLATCLRSLDAEVTELEVGAWPTIDALANRVSRRVLEEVREVKLGLNRLVGRVQRLRTELGEILEDDADMADMYLRRRAAQQGHGLPPLPRERRRHRRNAADLDDVSEAGGEAGGEAGTEGQRAGADGGGRASGNGARVDPHTIEEAEDLLETYSIQADFLLRRLLLLAERIEDTEELVDLELDHRRNELVALTLLVGVVAASFGFVSMIAGLLGMNMYNVQLWQESKGAFIGVLIGASVGGLVILVGIVGYIRHKRLMFIPTTL